MQNVIQIENLKFKYEEEFVLKLVNLVVQKGSFVSIIGPNGSGKTTLLKNICNLLRPNEGAVIVKDEQVSNVKPRTLAKTMAVVHQNASIEFDFKVEDVVLMGRFPYLGRFQSETHNDLEIAKNAMELTSTDHLKHKNIKAISGGERQRVMIARALTQEPEILLLDEPISHLDIKHQLDILKLCKELNHEKELTILTTLHDINLAMRYSDYIVLMNQGEIVTVGKPVDVVTIENIKKVYEIDVKIVEVDGLGTNMVIPL